MPPFFLTSQNYYIFLSFFSFFIKQKERKTKVRENKLSCCEEKVHFLTTGDMMLISVLPTQEIEPVIIGDGKVDTLLPPYFVIASCTHLVP